MQLQLDQMGFLDGMASCAIHVEIDCLHECCCDSHLASDQEHAMQMTEEKCRRLVASCLAV